MSGVICGGGVFEWGHRRNVISFLHPDIARILHRNHRLSNAIAVLTETHDFEPAMLEGSQDVHLDDLPFCTALLNSDGHLLTSSTNGHRILGEDLQVPSSLQPSPDHPWPSANVVMKMPRRSQPERV